MKKMHVLGKVSPTSCSLFSVLFRDRVICNYQNSSFKSWVLENFFVIMFKCMSGFTIKNGKFVLPLQEKMSYENSPDRCDSFGFTNHFYGLDKYSNNYLNQWKLIESLQKTWTTNSPCSRRQ